MILHGHDVKPSGSAWPSNHHLTCALVSATTPAGWPHWTAPGW